MNKASDAGLHWVDGERALTIPLPDRGLDYGDGLFETLLFANNELLYLERHLQRLSAGLAALGFPACTAGAAQALSDVCLELVRMDFKQAACRLTVTRGSGPRGYSPPSECSPRFIISVSSQATDWDSLRTPVDLGTSSVRLAGQRQLAGIKHLNRLEQVLASRERVAAGLDEMLMLDDKEQAVCVISGNLFAVLDGRIVTPPIQHCGVLGTRRQLLIERWAPLLGMPVDELFIDLETIELAQELFYTNALLGLCPVGRLGARVWPENPICEALHAIYISDSIRGGEDCGVEA